MMSRMRARCAFLLALAGALVGGTAYAADVHVMISAGFYGAYAAARRSATRRRRSRPAWPKARPPMS